MGRKKERKKERRKKKCLHLSLIKHTTIILGTGVYSKRANSSVHTNKEILS